MIVFIVDGSYARNKSLNYVFLSGVDNNISHDEPDCLFQPLKVQCSTLNYILNSIITNQLLWIDTIYVINFLSTEDQTVHVPEMTPTADAVPRKVNIICLKSCVYDKNLIIYADIFQTIFVLQLEGFLFHNSTISLQSVHTIFKNVRFVESVVTDLEHTEKVFGQIELHFEQTIFEGHSGININCVIHINKVFIANVFIQSSQFSFVSTQLSAHNLFLNFRNSSFIGSQIHTNNKMLIVAKLESVLFTGSSSPDSNVPAFKIVGRKIQADFIDCVFDNSTGLKMSNNDSKLIDSWMEITTENCIFQQNRKIGSGGAISVYFVVPLVQAKKGFNFLKIVNSTTTHNEAVRIGSVLSQGGALNVRSLSNTDSCSLLQVKIENSTFTNNKAADGVVLCLHLASASK